MLFSEFKEGTGCRDNEYNHKVYRDLEVMYMNSELSKAEIYEYGKKLVDNSKSEKELEFERQIKEEIEIYKTKIVAEKNDVEYRKAIEDKDMLAYHRNNIRHYRQKIRELKWVLGM